MQLQMTGMKVFSATTFKDRHILGEKITDWIGENPQKQIVDRVVLQSSDAEFHCLTIVLMYYDANARPVTMEDTAARMLNEKKK